uniref:2-oxo-4-hydroxy-4-carboxy-5-ureidoimidazoline decarboxylase n=1 Tax=Denticeps clupeoides TaxID=299321 RepID=A0AAY4AM98_9TELE
MDIAQLNSLSYEDFVDVLGNVVERCPLVAAAVWSGRPFASVSELEGRIHQFLDSLPESGKDGVLRCHPDLAGRELRSGTLTAESQAEQRQAGMAALAADELSRLARLNAQYKRRFGFPFVVCARLHDAAAVMRLLAARLGAERAAERERALGEVKRICGLRLIKSHLLPVCP